MSNEDTGIVRLADVQAVLKDEVTKLMVKLQPILDNFTKLRAAVRRHLDECPECGGSGFVAREDKPKCRTACRCRDLRDALEKAEKTA